VLRRLLLLLVGALWWSVVGAQELPFRIGAALVPGVQVALPSAKSLQGEAVAAPGPKLVIFTMVEGCDLCATLHLIADTWRRRYPALQVILVDTRTPAEAVAQWVQRERPAVPVVADADDRFEEAFDTNRVPLFYLLDAENVVRDKMMGFGYARYLAFDQQLERANEGRWSEVAQHAVAPPVLGEAAAPLASLAFADQPTVVYKSSSLCEPCREMLAEGLQAALNRLAEARPEVQWVVLEPERDAARLEGLYREIEAFMQRFGEAALPPETKEALQGLTEADLQGTDPNAVFLPESGWHEAIRLLRYAPGSADDPAARWGVIFSPNVMVFAPGGRFLGPSPTWFGPYGVAALEEVVAQLLLEEGR
jgi:hypothetical protein